MGPLSTVILDTNILIDALNGIATAVAYLDALDGWQISVITHIEVLAGSMSVEEESSARLLLRNCAIFPLNAEVADRAAILRRSDRLKLPDAVIFATAIASGCQLATRNTRDFGLDNPLIVVPYRL